MIEFGPNLTNMLEQDVHHLCTIWRLERTDGLVLRFTSNTTPLVYDGETYIPTNGLSASATQLQAQLAARNLEAVGIIDSESITTEDLRAGLFRDAKVTYRVVNARFPWAGAFLESVYYIVEVSWTGQSWTAKVEGLTARLQRPIGRLYTRNCRHRLGDANCAVDVSPFTFAGEVTSVVHAYSRFGCHGSANTDILSKANGYFEYGQVLWTSGLNEGTKTDVQRFGTDSALSAGHAYFTGQLYTPFQIQVGDTFTAVVGCDKTLENCRGADNPRPWAPNQARFGGFPTIPGNDRMLLIPKSKV